MAYPTPKKILNRVDGAPAILDRFAGEWFPVWDDSGNHTIFPAWNDGTRLWKNGYAYRGATPGFISLAANTVPLDAKARIVEAAVGGITMNRLTLISDGTNWHFDGIQTCFADAGTIGSPLAHVTGITSGLIMAVGTFPANLLVSRGTEVEFSALVRKNNANATATVGIALGATNIVTRSLTITDKSEGWLYGKMYVKGAGNQMITLSSTPNGQTTNVFTTASVDLTIANAINIGISAANAADSFDLLAYSVKIS